MFNRYLIIKNRNTEDLYLYMNDYYEFSSEFNSGEKLQKNLRDIVTSYIREKNIKFNGRKIFIVLSGIVISYVTLDSTIPLKNSWVSDFEPIIKDDDRSDIIQELIDTKVELDI